MYDLLESERLKYRRITHDDFHALCEILQDASIMYAWEHAFSDAEVQDWINENINRYEKDGYSYLAAFDKASNELVGMVGLLTEHIEGKDFVGIGYILNKKFWGNGYAIEGARFFADYAFDVLEADKVVATIRPNNTSSRKVAEKLGMHIEGEYVRPYKGKDMPHLIYSISK